MALLLGSVESFFKENIKQTMKGYKKKESGYKGDYEEIRITNDMTPEERAFAVKSNADNRMDNAETLHAKIFDMMEKYETRFGGGDVKAMKKAQDRKQRSPIADEDMKNMEDSEYAKNMTKSIDPSAPMEGCIELNMENLERVIGGQKYTVILFYTQWSGTCKRLAVEYEKFVKQIFRSADQISKVVPAKVDCDAHPRVCEIFDVEDYPQILYLPRRSKLEDAKTATAVTGGRNAGAFSTIVIDTALQDASFGRVKKFDKFVTKWMKLSPKKKNKELLGKEKGKFGILCKEAYEANDDDGKVACHLYGKYLEIILENGVTKSSRILQKTKKDLANKMDYELRDPQQNYLAFVESNIVSYIMGEMLEHMEE